MRLGLGSPTRLKWLSRRMGLIEPTSSCRLERVSSTSSRGGVGRLWRRHRKGLRFKIERSRCADPRRFVLRSLAGRFLSRPRVRRQPGTCVGWTLRVKFWDPSDASPYGCPRSIATVCMKVFRWSIALTGRIYSIGSGPLLVWNGRPMKRRESWRMVRRIFR